MSQPPVTPQLSSDLIAFMNVGCFSCRGEIHEANSVIAKLLDYHAHLKSRGLNDWEIFAETPEPYKVCQHYATLSFVDLKT